MVRVRAKHSAVTHSGLLLMMVEVCGGYFPIGKGELLSRPFVFLIMIPPGICTLLSPAPSLAVPQIRGQTAAPPPHLTTVRSIFIFIARSVQHFLSY